jgi:hypothetical protein
MRKQLGRVAEPHHVISFASSEFDDIAAFLYVNEDLEDRKRAWRGIDTRPPNLEFDDLKESLRRASNQLAFLKREADKVETVLEGEAERLDFRAGLEEIL